MLEPVVYGLGPEGVWLHLRRRGACHAFGGREKKKQAVGEDEALRLRVDTERSEIASRRLPEG